MPEFCDTKNYLLGIEYNWHGDILPHKATITSKGLRRRLAIWWLKVTGFEEVLK